MTKRIYCHVYQGNSQGSGKLNDYSINNVKHGLDAYFVLDSISRDSAC